MKHKFYQSSDLVDRLCTASDRNDRSVVFLVGSAISLPDYEGGHGVPGVSGIVDLIRLELHGSDAASDFDNLIANEAENPYQKAFEYLQGRRGQDTVNKIIRRAVWCAIKPTAVASLFSQDVAPPNEINSETLKALDNEPAAWRLPKAVDLLGGLLVNHSNTFGRAVLTTNFDPLIEISILKHEGQRYRTVLPVDGNLEQTVSEGVHVVHLHGYWWGYDTLHTPQQLGLSRPNLKRSLSRIIETSTLVVLGYGGWDDVITQTLMEIVADPVSTPEVLWTFHSSSASDIASNKEALLKLLEPGIHRGRVVLYQNVECVSLLSNVSERLKSSHISPNEMQEEAQAAARVKDLPTDVAGRRLASTEVSLSPSAQLSPEPDSPLIVDPWIGREQELQILDSTNLQVCFITGIGGQGKSALVGRFLKNHCFDNTDRYDFWDWRDCKEESDRLNTQLLRLIDRLSDGSMDSQKIETTDIRAVIDIMFGLLQDRRALLVFDNVDQYVDLETLRLVKGLDHLVAEAQARNHQSLFLFTCRLDVQIEESRSLRLPLQGLTETETRQLLDVRGIPNRYWHLGKELHQMTEGHPLWISLIVMQAVRNNGNLDEALQFTNRGGGQLPDTTRSIWGTLNNQQQDVLRTLAELDRPETESQLQRLLPGMRFNRFYRALKTLRSYHLVEVRTQPEGEPLLGLHPIIREFIRTNFPKKEREKYVEAVMGYLEFMIDQFRVMLAQEPSYQILEYWIRKAELQITFGHFEESFDTISEISSSMINRGYSEEFVRVTLRLLRECDWAIACSSYKKFDGVFQECVTQMTHLGHNSVEELLSRYKESIPGKSAQYILLSDLRCYVEWYDGNFEAAIHWGEEGNRLKEDTSVDTAFSSKHNLALAKRDGGYVLEAMEMFLDGELLSDVVSPEAQIDGKQAHYYGNIGRCLHFLERFDEALSCYIKSAKLLQSGRTRQDYQNRGYIRLWIGQLLRDGGELELAAACLRAAICIWDEVSPPRSLPVREELENLGSKHAELAVFIDEEDWRVEGIFSNWLENRNEELG